MSAARICNTSWHLLAFLTSALCFLSFLTHQAGAAATGIQVQLVLEDEPLESKQASSRFVPLPTPRSDHVALDRSYLRSASSSSERRELSIWSSFMNFVKCPIDHEKNPHCQHHHHHHSGGGGGSHSGGSGGGSGGGGGSGTGGDQGGGSGGGGSGTGGDQGGGSGGGGSGTGGDQGGNNGGDVGYYSNDADNGSNVICNNKGCTDSTGNTIVTCQNNSCVDQNGDYVGDYCNANGCFGNNGDLYYDLNRSPTQSPSPLDTISNDSPGWTNLSSEMVYGAIGLGGIAVAAGLFMRKKRQNVNMNDHLLSGAVSKRKKTFAQLFRKQQPDMDAAETPGATHYVKA